MGADWQEEQPASFSCFWPYSKYKCRKTYNVGSSICASCAPDHYGTTCISCNCGPGGVCTDGITGDGTCACHPGYTGSSCASGESRSDCYCDQCTSNYVSDGSLCVGPCPDGDCGVGGVCLLSKDGTPKCQCSDGWSEGAGGGCSVCTPGYYLETRSNTCELW